jgi:hypothetical protein
MTTLQMTQYHTFNAARWVVCGIQRIRTHFESKCMPSVSHRFSKASTRVSLLDALSIMIAMTYNAAED